MLKVQEDLHASTQSSPLDHEPINKGVSRGSLDNLAYGNSKKHATFSPTSTLGSSNLVFGYLPPVDMQVIGSSLIDRASRRHVPWMYSTHQFVPCKQYHARFIVPTSNP